MDREVTLGAFSLDDDVDAPERARLVVTKEFRDRVFLLRSLCAEHDLFEVVDFNDSVVWEYGYAVEMKTLAVSRSSFCFRAFCRGTRTTMETKPLHVGRFFNAVARGQEDFTEGDY